MKNLALVGLMLLASCGQSKVEMLEEYYDGIGDGYSASERRCETATKIADQYAEQADAARYSQWKLTADIDCMAAQAETRL